MINEENQIISNEEINDEEPRIIPLPELAKDFALIVSTIILLMSMTVALLGYWRRQIVQEDPMTKEFRELMERGNHLSKDE